MYPLYDIDELDWLHILHWQVRGIWFGDWGAIGELDLLHILHWQVRGIWLGDWDEQALNWQLHWYKALLTGEFGLRTSYKRLETGDLTFLDWNPDISEFLILYFSLNSSMISSLRCWFLADGSDMRYVLLTSLARAESHVFNVSAPLQVRDSSSDLSPLCRFGSWDS